MRASQSEKLAESRGRTGTMFVKYNRMGGGFTADTSVLSTSKPSMTFFTDRFQKTVVTLVIAADTVKYTLTM